MNDKKRKGTLLDALNTSRLEWVLSPDVDRRFLGVSRPGGKRAV